MSTCHEGYSRQLARRKRRSARLPEGASSLNAEERPNYYGSSTATGMGVAGTPIGATELGGVKRSTDMYRQPYGAVSQCVLGGAWNRYPNLGRRDDDST